MANVTETPSYDAGIYQIETTDPVLGGPNGIANAQAKGLANRTAFLKQQIDQLNSGQLAPAWIASQSYVQEQLQKLDAKQSVRAATVANITLSGVQTIDGVTLTVGDRALVKDQTTAAQNGIYLVAAQGWTRTTDADSGEKFNGGARVYVDEGTLNSSKTFVLSNVGAVNVGSTALTFIDEHAPATESTKGITRYATQNDVNSSPQMDDAAISPKTLFGWVKQATESVLGMVRVATQEQTEAGTADDVAITPKKLAFGFTVLFADNGYIRFPKWLGNFVIQWGVVSSNASGDCIITFPDAHKTGCFCVIPISGSNMNAAYAFSSKTLTQAIVPLFNTSTGAKSGAGHNIQYVTFGR